MQRKILGLMMALMFIIFLMTPAGAQEPSPDSSPDPLPPLQDVPETHLIQPNVGLGKVRFGMELEAVEEVFGRGTIMPGESDFQGNSQVSLTYREKGLTFVFFNGELMMITIRNPSYATGEGTRVGGDIGDAIREFGTSFRQDKSLVQSPDPALQDHEIFFDKKNIAFTCKGVFIMEIKLRTPHKMKVRKK